MSGSDNKNNNLNIPQFKIEISNYESINSNMKEKIPSINNISSLEKSSKNEKTDLQIPTEDFSKLSINNMESNPYQLIITKENEEQKTLNNNQTKPKLQNDAFLNLNNLYPLNRSNSNGSQSDFDNSPKGTKKINFMMKNLFNNTPDRENQKKNVYLSPIQQYFDSSPKFIDNSVGEKDDFDFNKQNLSYYSYNNSINQEKEDFYLLNNLNDDKTLTNNQNNAKLFFPNNLNTNIHNNNINNKLLNNNNINNKILNNNNINNKILNNNNINNKILNNNNNQQNDSNYPFTNHMNINFNYNTNINMGINDQINNLHSMNNINPMNNINSMNNINHMNNLNSMNNINNLNNLNNLNNPGPQNINNAFFSNPNINNNIEDSQKYPMNNYLSIPQPNNINNTIMNNNYQQNFNDVNAFSHFYMNFQNQYNNNIQNNGNINNSYMIRNQMNLNNQPSIPYQMNQSNFSNYTIPNNIFSIQNSQRIKNANITNNNNNNSNNNNIILNNQIKFNKSRRIINTSNLYKLDNSEIAKQSYNLAKDQIGCRFLQKKIEEDTQFSLNSIYPIILEHLLETITDQFGNYLIQKFFEYLNDKQLNNFLDLINSSFANIGINQYGTRVIQKLMDYINNNEKELYDNFVNLVKPNIVLFSNDINGCHIIQKIMLTKNFNNDFCYEKIDECIEQIANHKNGCCFLQKCIEKIKGNELEKILNAVNKKIRLLIVDQYGNYVIQFIFKINGDERNKNIFDIMVKDLTFYSNQKFSSNVIEKFFLFDNLKNKLISKIIEKENLKKLLFDPYGNYVVQKALSYSDNQQQYEILCKIAPLVYELKSLNFGIKLYHKLTIKYPILINIVQSLENNL